MTNESGKLPMQHSARYLAFKAPGEDGRRRKREARQTRLGQTANAGVTKGRKDSGAATGRHKRRRFDAAHFAATGTLVRATSPSSDEDVAANADNKGATGTTHDTGNSGTTTGLLPAAWRGNFWGYVADLRHRAAELHLGPPETFEARRQELMTEGLSLWNKELEHGQAALEADLPIDQLCIDPGAFNAQAARQPQETEEKEKESGRK